MGLENTNPNFRPNDFNINWPEGLDDYKYGDDHIRLVKLATYNFYQDFESYKVEHAKLFDGDKIKEAVMADDSKKLNGKDPDNYALIDGTYDDLRAKATTKDDVGLGRVDNFYSSNAINDPSTTRFATAYAVKTAYDLAAAANNKAHSADGYDAIGSYIYAQFIADRVYPPQGGPNTIVAGSRLRAIGIRRDSNGRISYITASTGLSGSWRVMGYAGALFPSASQNQYAVTLFQRVS